MSEPGGSRPGDDSPTSRWYEEEERDTPSGWMVEPDSTRARRPDHGATHLEPAREVPVHLETEVLVVGGGPAGCAAATAAARMGADVVLVERYGHLGGLATGGLVFWIDRMTDWSGRQVIAGYAADVIERLPKDAVFGPPRDALGLDRSGRGRVLEAASQGLSRDGDLVADRRPGVAQARLGRAAAGGGCRAAAAQLGGAGDHGGQRRPRDRVREQAGTSRRAGQGRRRRDRRPRSLRAGGGSLRVRRRHRRRRATVSTSSGAGPESTWTAGSPSPPKRPMPTGT